MTLVALITWLITASFGMYLLAIWLIEYDHEFQSAAATRLPVPVICAHVLFALGGLAVWATYLITDISRLAWVAAVILGVVVLLGISMAARWFGVYRAHPAPSRSAAAVRTGVVAASARLGSTGGTSARAEAVRRDGAPAEAPRVPVPPERHFPLPVVVAHGLFAGTTIILVLLTVLDIFGG